MTPEHSFTLTCGGDSRQPDHVIDRKCRLLDRLSAGDEFDRNEYWLAEVIPAFIGQIFDLGAEDIGEVILMPMFIGHSLCDDHWKVIPVRVFRILDKRVIETRTLCHHQFSLILWCEIRRQVSPDA